MFERFKDWTRTIADLELKVRDQEARMKAVETEWGEIYDKLRKMQGRLVKERALAAEPSVAPTPTRAELLMRAKHAG